GPELDVGALVSGVERLAFAYDQALRPAEGLDDAAAIAALRMLPAATASAIVQTAIQRPLSEWQRAQLDRGDFGGMLETPFERKRAADATRAALKESAGPLPELPLKLRVYCGVELGAYDFDAGGFAFERNSCDAGLGGLRGVELAGESPVPAVLAMPPEEAEAFVAAQRYFFFLASFDADLDFKVKRTELGAVLSNRSGLRLHGHKDPGQITWIAPAEAAASAPVAAPPQVERGPWVLHDAEDQAEMVALAGAPKSFPADGAALIAAGGEALGLVDEPSRTRAREDGSVWPAELFDTYHKDARLALATALSVPLDYVIELRGPTSGQGLGGIYGLLPAPASSYAAMPPADLYGEGDLRYRWTAAVTGLHAFDIPGEGVLLAVLQPLEGRFITTDDRNPEVLESFDLSARVLPADVELISPESMATIVLATSGGADPVETLTEKMDKQIDIFDRTDLASRLVQEETDRGGPPDAFWVAGEMRLGEYDMKAEAFPATSVQIGPIDVLRRDDLASWAFPYLRVDGAAFALRMDPEHARAWARENSGQYATYRFRGRIGVESASEQAGVDARLLEAEILAPDAVATRRDPEDVLWRYEIEAAAAAAAAAPPTAAAAPAEPPAPEPVTRDILGIALGTPLEEALATVAAEIVPSASYAASRETIPGKTGVPDVLAWGSFATATLLYNEAS
ncbi:MAG TPA: hypothetical protein VFN28_11185, partial [Amaricoccus sp.]|nr:hypothetical protein [Amaricoccus sp.]